MTINAFASVVIRASKFNHKISVPKTKGMQFMNKEKCTQSDMGTNGWTNQLTDQHSLL
jgi:hypothetical protein